MPELPYPGGELEVFAKAQHWKAYWRARIAPWVQGTVLEVGAGIGANTLALRDQLLRAESWVCLEPDPGLADRCREQVDCLPCEVVTGTVNDLGERRFDCVLYLDVLEHIADDAAELAQAAALLRAGGRLVVLSPAHPWLYSPFDRAIGHHRRYTRRRLAGLQPAGTRPRCLAYLDAVGLLASAANRLLLRQSLPSHQQIQTWDRLLVPASRWLLDPLTGGHLGKSVLAVWEAV
jgi:SAM-dependent methyltransferase